MFLTGDEEAPGASDISRLEFIETGKRSDAALCFEGGSRRDGRDYVSTARRGASTWQLTVKAVTAHSSGIFSDERGDGAAYEMSRILSAFHEELREPQLTYNVGLVVVGAEPKIDPSGHGATTGKVNIIPGEAVAIGDIRAVDRDQLARTMDKMGAIAGRSLAKTSAGLSFSAGYPPMSATPGNRALLSILNDGSRALGLPETLELDPMQRGAGDISFVAPYVDSLSGLGANGGGDHAPGESVDLDRLPVQAKRAALLIHRLTR